MEMEIDVLPSQTKPDRLLRAEKGAGRKNYVPKKSEKLSVKKLSSRC